MTQYPYSNPYTAQQFQQLSAYQPAQMQYSSPMLPFQQQVPGRSIKVDGPVEAMNRFMMMYPANLLVPGFISDPLFDVNGRQFYTLSIEADGRRNLETFDYNLHVEERPAQDPGVQYATREELNKLAAKVESMTGVDHGVHAAVPTESVPAPAGAYAGPGGLHDAGQGADAKGPDRR